MNVFFIKLNECETCGRFDQVPIAIKPHEEDIELVSTFSSLNELEEIIEKNKPVVYSLLDATYFPIHDTFQKEYTFEQFKNMFIKEVT